MSKNEQDKKLLCLHLPNPSPGAQRDTRSNILGLNFEFSFSQSGCHPKVKNHSLPYYSRIVGRRIERCIPFPRVFALWGIQTASCRIWTWISLSISSNSNRYTTSASWHQKNKSRRNNFFVYSHLWWINMRIKNSIRSHSRWNLQILISDETNCESVGFNSPW